MKKPNYTLKAGAIVHPQGTSNFYALNNIPDEVAENWLGQFPNEIFKFETYPADWESRVKARKEGTVVEPTIDELKAKVEALEAANEAKDVEIEALKANGSTDDGAAAMEIETLKADLATANENVEKAKAEGQAEVEALNKTIDELKAKVEALEAELDAAKKKTTKKAAAAE